MNGPEIDWRREPVLGICGLAGSGRAAVVAHVTEHFTERGLLVAVLPHSSSGINGRTGHDRELEQRVGALLANHDLILIQGDATTEVPSVWCGGDVFEAGGDAPLDCRAYLPSDNPRMEIAIAAAIERLEAAHRRRPVFGAVLIGGASRRMGFPKHLAVVGGETLLERVAAALEPEVESILVVGSGELPVGNCKLERVDDAVDCGTGPVAGILTALRSAPRACWVIAACDMAAIGADAVRWLLGERAPGRWAVLPRDGDRIEPLLALYEPQAYSLLEDLRVAGRMAPREMTGSARVHSPVIPHELRFRWTNVNRRADLDRIRTLFD